jgi:hypothetical protein
MARVESEREREWEGREGTDERGKMLRNSPNIKHSVVVVAAAERRGKAEETHFSTYHTK